MRVYNHPEVPLDSLQTVEIEGPGKVAIVLDGNYSTVDDAIEHLFNSGISIDTFLVDSLGGLDHVLRFSKYIDYLESVTTVLSLDKLDGTPMQCIFRKLNPASEVIWTDDGNRTRGMLRFTGAYEPEAAWLPNVKLVRFMFDDKHIPNKEDITVLMRIFYNAKIVIVNQLNKVIIEKEPYVMEEVD